MILAIHPQLAVIRLATEGEAGGSVGTHLPSFCKSMVGQHVWLMFPSFHTFSTPVHMEFLLPYTFNVEPIPCVWLSTHNLTNWKGVFSQTHSNPMRLFNG